MIIIGLRFIESIGSLMSKTKQKLKMFYTVQNFTIIRRLILKF